LATKRVNRVWKQTLQCACHGNVWGGRVGL
jgi:hypothetical protein